MLLHELIAAYKLGTDIIWNATNIVSTSTRDIKAYCTCIDSKRRVTIVTTYEYDG